MKKSILRCIIYVAIAALTYYGYLAWRAGRNLVTLNVRDMPIREVVRKIERQTWELIVTHRDVEGKVTLNVKDQPLEAVLAILGSRSRCVAIWSLRKAAGRTCKCAGPASAECSARTCGARTTW
jgi:type II secretory pathway component GspD/PulD (secretin)